MELTNKVALITGGASGLGLATAEALIKSGAKVMLLDLNEDNAKAASESLGENASYAIANVTEFLEVGFSMWASDLVDLTFFNNINHWENSIFMDLGDIIAPSGDPVSEVQLAELEPYEIISDGSSSSAYPFNLGYSSTPDASFVSKRSLP